ncbi:MAG: hypothetical protein KUG76_02950 [Gammaproteobacteria bacterium]|nr:hypothetical protein [Gammaproteobacteria bacterium]
MKLKKLDGFMVRRIAVFATLFSCFISIGPVWAEGGFPEMEATRFQTLLNEYEKNPTILAEQRDLIKELSPQQLSDAIDHLGLNHYTYLHPVEIRGKEMPALLGKDINQYSVMSVRGGKMIPIPFQLDEYDDSGFVYLEGEGDIDGTIGIIDEEDELVFMYRDSGRQRYDAATMPVSGKVVRELEFTKNGGKRYAYVMEGSSDRNKARYVDYDIKTSTAKNVFYGFQTQTDNFLMFKDFYANVGDKQGHRVLDSVYATIETHVLSTWSPKVHLNTFEHIKAVPIGVVKGPVRDAVIIALTVVVAKVPVFKIRAQMDIYDQMLGFNARINIPGADILSRFLVEPHIIIALDFNEQSGARVNAAISPEADGWDIVDGKVSDFESKMDIDRERTWLWLSSGHGWDVFARINIPETFPVGVQLYYQDDPDDHIAYENFPGAYPRMGFDVYELPKDFSQIDLDVQFFFPDMLGMGPSSFHKNETGAVPELAINKLAKTTTNIAAD